MGYLSGFSKVRFLENYDRYHRLTRQASLPSLNDKKAATVSAPPPKSNNGLHRSGNTGGSGGFVVARSPSSAKEVILTWVQERTKNYSVSIGRISDVLNTLRRLKIGFGAVLP